MKNTQGYYFTMLVMCMSMLFIGCSSKTVEKNLNGAIDKIESTYAKDRRTDRFDVEVAKSGDNYVFSGTTTSVVAKDELLKEAALNDVNIVDNIVTYPDKTVGNQTWGLVNLSVCNIRSNPKHSAELATQEVMGTTLRVLTKKGEWYLVQTPNRYLGWLDHGGLIRLTDSQMKHWNDQPKRMSYVQHNWVYSSPTGDAEIVSDIVIGSVVIDKNNSVGGFYEVELPDGRSGFISTENSLNLSANTGSDFVETAKRFLGVPYLWGGTSAKGFDCSGYTKSIYAYHGYLLPRDASQQVRVGILIDTDKTWKNLLPGDLLFFGNLREDDSERITHVAIYMGNGKIIHAAGRVKIESLNPKDADFAKDRYETFMKAKRMVKDGIEYPGVQKL